MEDFVEAISAGHATEVKIVLTSVVAALAIWGPGRERTEEDSGRRCGRGGGE